jgi:hypothetical protein
MPLNFSLSHVFGDCCSVCNVDCCDQVGGENSGRRGNIELFDLPLGLYIIADSLRKLFRRILSVVLLMGETIIPHSIAQCDAMQCTHLRTISHIQ